eukprot:CAMPEP_0202726946 /NCGR_PEP_ID=MMETSP1385-20130828/184870_1 /ASSEMBLY_ACC=CAM_ASM_000861 /TAXON_ID=933848 /ORGANISM="Elphidium margaritaceum" /LENGTH=447 /DNA_ID=CAMNT_0049393175 /DNA_START=78 /DNA_END=1419 /DNA_ORIENTATION=+
MKAIFAGLLLVVIICMQQQMVASVATTIEKVTITTDSANPGDGAAPLTMTLYWGDYQYSCNNTPASGTTEYSCDSSSQSSYTQDAANPYFLKLEYSTETDALQINMVNITDADGNWYALDEFCIPPLMSHTMDNVVSASTSGGFAVNGHRKCRADGNWYAFDEFCIPPLMRHTMDAVISGSTSEEFCGNGLASKVSYTDLAIAGDTKFVWLYVDFKIFGDRFANTVNEAGVRPPNLIETGYTVLEDHEEPNIEIMIQWDTVLYTTQLSSLSPGQTVSVSVDSFSSMATCPGIESSFTASYYNPNIGFTATFHFGSVFFKDETLRSYTLNAWCLEQQPGFLDYYSGSATYERSGGDCSSFGTEYVALNGIQIAAGDASNPDLAPVLVPSTIFEFPDNSTNGVATEVLAGYFVTTGFSGTAPDLTEFCWERPVVPPCVSGYGIPGNAQC